MVLIGPQTSYRQRFDSSRYQIRMGKRRNRLWNFQCVAVLIVILAMIAACAPTIEYGSKARTDALETLTISSSTAAEIESALGKPRGYGVARFALDLVPRDLWFYEYVRTDGKVIDLKILIVLLKDDRYDGHFWFSSVELLEPLE